VDDGGGVVPGDFVLRQNYPNPFNPSTVIEYALPEPVQVRLEVFNLLGRRVRTLADGFRPPGQYRVVWDGTNEAGYSVASGTYFYRITSGDRIETRKLLLIR